MSRHHETNPHFLPRQRDPVIDFPSKTPPRSRPPPRHHGRTPVVPPPHSRPPVEVPYYYGRTPVEVEPPHHGRPVVEAPHYSGRTPVESPPHGRPVVEAPNFSGLTPIEPPPHGRPVVEVPHYSGRTPIEPSSHGRTQVDAPPRGHTSPRPPKHGKPMAPLHVEAPHQPQSDSHARPPQHSDGSRGRRHHPAFIHPPSSQRTTPIAWLVAAFCTLFWILVIVGGVIILIVYLVFRPRNPRFDISSVTFNAAYLDMGYLLNADVTVLANFTNPNSKVKVEFSYVILDLYYDNNFIATRYIEPFSVMRGESRFADVHMVASQVGMSRAHSMQLQKQMEEGKVNLEIKGLFRTRSKLGGIFKYSYWLYAHCQLVVTAPPTGVLIGKKCILKR